MGIYGPRLWRKRQASADPHPSVEQPSPRPVLNVRKEKPEVHVVTPSVDSVAPDSASQPSAEVGPEPPAPTEALSADDSIFAEKLMSLIDQRLDQRNLQVDMLASEMAMSHTLFYERVNRVFGDSPASIIRNRRLQRARDMLAEGGHSVVEVSTLCGFSDAKYFSTVFKKHYGVSPSQI